MKYFYIIVALIGLALVAFWGWNKLNPEFVHITTITVGKGNVEESVANTRAGTVMACRRAKMSPSLGGQISKLPFAEGETAKQNDILLELWNADLKADIEQAKKNVISSQDSADAQCFQADIAKRTTERLLKLKRVKAIPVQDYDKAKAESDALKATCAAAKSSVDVAKVAVIAAQARLQRTILHAPFSGVVAKINGELNEYVTPSPPGILTPPVIDLIEPNCFYVSAPIDEVDAPKIKTGMSARITLDAWRSRQFDARVSRIGSYVVDYEKQARTVDVELKFINNNDLKDLLVGYSADVDIITKIHKNVLRIPREAVIDEQYVLLFNQATQQLEKRSIKQGLSNWDTVEVSGGLKEGDVITTSIGKTGVKAGAHAKVDKSGDD